MGLDCDSVDSAPKCSDDAQTTCAENNVCIASRGSCGNPRCLRAVACLLAAFLAGGSACVSLYIFLIYMHTYIYVYIYTHTHTHTYLHTYIHIYCIHCHNNTTHTLRGIKLPLHPHQGLLIEHGVGSCYTDPQVIMHTKSICRRIHCLMHTLYTYRCIHMASDTSDYAYHINIHQMMMSFICSFRRKIA